MGMWKKISASVFIVSFLDLVPLKYRNIVNYAWIKNFFYVYILW